MTEDQMQLLHKPEYMIGAIATLLQAMRLTLSVLDEEQRHYVTEGMKEFRSDMRRHADSRDTDTARDHAEAAWDTAEDVIKIEDWVETFTGRLRG